MKKVKNYYNKIGWAVEKKDRLKANRSVKSNWLTTKTGNSITFVQIVPAGVKLEPVLVSSTFSL